MIVRQLFGTLGCCGCVVWMLWSASVFAQVADAGVDSAVDAAKFAATKRDAAADATQADAADARPQVAPPPVQAPAVQAPISKAPPEPPPPIEVAPAPTTAADAAADSTSVPAAEPQAPLPKVVISFNDAPLFSLRLGRGGRTLEERAAAAHRALESVAKEATADSVRSAARDGVVIVYVRDVPIVQLTAADAEAAGDSSLDVHAAGVLASVREAIAREQQRREIANTAFSVSLVVLLGLITVYLLRRFHDLADRGADYLSSPGRSVSSVRMSSIEVIAPGTLRSMLLVALSVARWLGSVGVVYAWLIVVLSLFDATRGYTQQLTGYVVNPLAALMGRVAASLPTFVVAFVAVLSVALLVRFVGLFFASVARGEASLSWVPPDLAMAVSAPLRVAIVVSALVFAAPVVTGNEDGSLTRLGELLLVALSLSSVPLLANAGVGLLIVWQRRIRVGERVELGETRGRVLGLDLWSVRLEEASGAEVHTPYLLLLLRPMRVFSLVRRVTVEVAVDESVASDNVLAALRSAAGDGFDQAVASVVRLAQGHVTYRLSARASSPNAESTLLSRVRDAMAQETIPVVHASVTDDLR